MNVFLSIQVLFAHPMTHGNTRHHGDLSAKKAAFNVETTMCRIAVSPISLYLAS